MHETLKELVEVASGLAAGAAKNMGIFALLVTVMPPMFVMGCAGTSAIFAYETGGKVIKAAKAMHAKRKKR